MDHAKWLVKTFTRQGSIVLDPFAGTGTIPIAAKILGHDFIAIEIEKKYCDNAIEKLKKIQPELFNHPGRSVPAKSFNLVLS